MVHRLLGPCRRFLRMAGCARIWNLELIGQRGCHEAECVRMDVRAWHTFGFNPRHMAGYALASRTPGLMMRMLLQRRFVRAIG